MNKKDINGLQRYNRTKVNTHWGMTFKIEHAIARHIKAYFRLNQRKNYI